MMTKVNKKPTCRGHSKETLNTKKKKERTKLKQPKERQNPKKCSDRQQKTNETSGSIKITI